MKDEIPAIKSYKKMSTGDLVLIALFASLITVSSWICVPSTVPFTMQTFGVFISVGLLGGRRGSLSVLIYLLLGAVGLPVFANFSGGIGYLFGPTGGYIIGFLLSALFMWLMEVIYGSNTKILAVSMVFGLIICYLLGTFWFSTVYSKNTGDIGFISAFGICVIPYIVPDMMKIALALMLTKKLRPYILLNG